jgi:hypothetical protein
MTSTGDTARSEARFVPAADRGGLSRSWSMAT